MINIVLDYKHRYLFSLKQVIPNKKRSFLGDLCQNICFWIRKGIEPSDESFRVTVSQLLTLLCETNP
jgi:hypothetical protein